MAAACAAGGVDYARHGKAANAFHLPTAPLGRRSSPTLVKWVRCLSPSNMKQTNEQVKISVSIAKDWSWCYMNTIDFTLQMHPDRCLL